MTASTTTGLDIAEVPDGAASTPVTLHPIVVVSISDHYTRQVARGAAPRAFGLLLGQCNGQRTEIYLSLDVAFHVDGNGSILIDESDADLMAQKRGLYQTTFPELDVLGWYSTGRSVTWQDIAVIQGCHVLRQMTEAPLILLCDPSPPPEQRSLPVWIIEQKKIGTAAPGYVKVPLNIESEEAERVGIDAAMRVDENAGRYAGIGPHARRMLDAVEALQARIGVVTSYLTAVENGTVEADYELIRQINEVVNQMPRGDAPRLRSVLEDDQRDALVITLLGIMNKGTAHLSKLGLDVNQLPRPQVTAVRARYMSGTENDHHRRYPRLSSASSGGGRLASY